MGEPAGLWFRVSSGGQDEALQVPQVEGYSDSKGYMVAARYTVHGKSAYHGEHQGYIDQALADAQAGKIKVLVVWHSDRLDRQEELVNLLRAFAEAGCRVESVQEPTLGQTDFGGKVTTYIQALVNREKSAHIAKQVGLAQASIAGNGAMYGRPCWGFTTEGEKYHRRMVPTPDGRRYAPVIFEMVATGSSLSEVAQFLTDAKVAVSYRGKPGIWWPRLVWKIVRNPAYFGQRTDAAGNVVHRCEPLVSLALWERANKALRAAATSQAKTRGAGRLERAMLTGAVYCGHCGDSPMYRIRAGNKGTRYEYYRCAGRGADRKSCGNMVRLDAVDNAVNEIAARTFFTPVMRLEVVEGHDYDAELSEVLEQLRVLPARLLDEDAEDAERARLRAEKKRLTGLANVPESVREVPTGDTYAGLWSALSNPERGPWLKRQGFRVSATKDVVALSQPGHPKGCQAMVHLREQASEMEVAA